jgi:DNA-3-methyladenine glycosylase
VTRGAERPEAVGDDRLRTPLPSDAYAGPAERIAVDLLGCWIVSEVGGDPCVVEVVETEAYTGPEDGASHAAARIGRTARNEAMFGSPGTAYIYRIYGLHWCLNAVTGPAGFPAAVLVRAARPVQGLEVMQRRRGQVVERDLLRGPGRLAQALGLEGSLNGVPLVGVPLRIVPGRKVARGEIRRGPRIGIRRAADAPLRFCIAGSRWVSRGVTTGEPLPAEWPDSRTTHIIGAGQHERS